VVRTARGALVGGELAEGLLGEHWWVVSLLKDCWGSIGGW
jgi:hypothetical protein